MRSQLPPATARDHHDAGADLGAVEKIRDVFVQHADTAGGDELADRRGLVGAVDAVDGRARYMARAPSGLPSPPAMKRGR